MTDGQSTDATDRIGEAPLHPSDESPQLRYCHRCVGDTLHGWDGDCWVCETCGRRWSA
jgi:hypothetical protein